MIGFFDTSVHVAILRGSLSLDAALQAVGFKPIRLSPVVASELLRGARGSGIRIVQTIVRTLVPIEPPSWRTCWYETGRLLPKIFPHHEAIGLGRLQNDILIALTARHSGAVLATVDRHFVDIRRHVDFGLRLLTA